MEENKNLIEDESHIEDVYVDEMEFISQWSQLMSCQKNA